jgi:hypothetical protein
MISNKKMMGRLACGVAMGVMAISPMAASAQDMSSSTSMSAPVQVTGTVLRYYVDRSGYVTAMDIQTANGVEIVRFSPGMGQRLYSTYPVGGQASVYVVGNAGSRWDVVGMGTTAPTNMMPSMISDVDLLEAAPYIVTGSKMVTVNGKLTNLILNEMGDVVGIVLDNSTLVRTPLEARNIAPGHAGTDRVTALFKGADVEVTGYDEAPRYGTLSQFGRRIAANSLVVNGRAVGSIGLPRMNPETTRSLFNNVNIGGAEMTPEEVRAMGAGYTIYSPSGSTMMGGNMMDSTTTSTSTTGTTTGR